MRINIQRRVPLAGLRPTLLLALVAAVLACLTAVGFLSDQADFQSDMWDCRPPYAESAEFDESPEQGFVICVPRDGSFRIGGERVYDNHLEQVLAIEARLCRNEDGSSDRRIWIRADEEAPWRSIRQIITLCQRDDIRIWRLTFLTRQDPD